MVRVGGAPMGVSVGGILVLSASASAVHLREVGGWQLECVLIA